MKKAAQREKGSPKAASFAHFNQAVLVAIVTAGVAVIAVVTVVVSDSATKERSSD
jgi:hypothetical protein